MPNEPHHGKNTRFSLGTAGTPTVLVDISDAFNQLDLNASADDVDATTFLATNKKHLVGVKDFALSGGGFVDTDVDAQLEALNGTEIAVDFEYGPIGDTPGNPKYTGTVYVQNYSKTSGVSAAVAFQFAAVAAGDVELGSYS